MNRRLAAFCVALAALSCKSPVDINNGFPYRCEPNLDGGSDPALADSQCAGGWRCMRDGLCHAPDDARAYSCVADTDCNGGWRCGLNHTCHARVPDAYACSRDAGDSDCEGDWRCGLDALCHARTAAAYACAADNDCEGGWRCDLLERRCIDSRFDGLRPDAAYGAATAERLSPLVFAGLPALVSVSPELADPVEGAGYSLALTRDAGMRFVVRYHPQALFSGQAFNAVARKVLFSDVTWPAPPTAVAALEHHAFAIIGNQVYDYAWAPDGGSFSAVSGFPGFTAADLRVSPMDPSALGRGASSVVAFSPSQYAYLTLGDATGTPAQSVPSMDGGTQEIHDLFSVVPGEFSGPEWVLAGSDGLFSTKTDKFGFILPDGGNSTAPYWYPVGLPSMPNLACGQSPVEGDFRAKRVRSVRAMSFTAQFPNTVLAVQAEPWPNLDGGVDQFFVYATRIVGGPPVDDTCAAGTLPYAGGGTTVLVAGPCPLCPPGYLPQSFQPGCTVMDICNTTASLEVRCSRAASSGPGPAFRVVTTGASGNRCDPMTDVVSDFDKSPLPEDQLAIAAAQSAAGQFAYANRNGELFLSAGSMALERASLTYRGDSERVAVDPPGAIVGSGDQLVLSSTSVGRSRLLLHPGLGVVEISNPHQFGDGVDNYVEGAPTWAVMRGNLEPFITDLLSASPGPDPIASFPLGLTMGEVHATVAESSDGGTWVVASMGDALIGGDVSPGAPSEMGKGVRLEIKVVPLSRGVITSLVALPAASMGDGGVAVANGYLLDQARLFRFVGSSALRWRTDEIIAPDGDPLEVLADGTRGRLGMSDGRVFSLPSRVLLAPALVDEPNGVMDYAQLCGQTYALASKGLYRLTAPSGEPVGGWVKEPSIDAPLSIGDAGYTKAVLHSAANELQVVTTQGRLARVRVQGCQ